MEKEGLLEYTAIPNFEKLGFEIMALSFSKWTSEAVTEMLPTEEFAKNVQTFFSKYPNVIFATAGGKVLEEWIQPLSPCIQIILTILGVSMKSRQTGETTFPSLSLTSSA